MKAVTHALTMNGQIHGELKDPLHSAEEVIQQRLALLDGQGRYSLCLWKLPDGVPFDKVSLISWPQEYIQAAGSQDRMTVEVRRQEAEGHRQYVIGRNPKDAQQGSTARTAIVWDGIETQVLPTEVFTAAEAAELFVTYYATAAVPNEYSLRPLDL